MKKKPTSAMIKRLKQLKNQSNVYLIKKPPLLSKKQTFIKKKFKKVIENQVKQKRKAKKQKKANIKNNKKLTIKSQLKKQNYKIFKKLNIQLGRICHFSEERRKKLRKSHPRLAPYIFYSAKQKKQFFKQLNQNYTEKIKTEKRKRPKKIRFQENQQVVVFDKRLKPKTISDEQIIIEPALHTLNSKSSKVYQCN